MISGRYFPTNIAELLNIVSRESCCFSEPPVIAIQAGHFLVYYDNTENRLVPGIESELNSPRLAPISQEIGRFPFLSWQLGLGLLNAISAGRKQILVLVNDWQYLPSTLNRASFYINYHRLPQAYVDALTVVDSDISLLTPKHYGKSLNTGDFFSEQALRKSYGRRLKQMIKDGTLPDGFEISSDGEHLTCTLHDAIGGNQEVYCTSKSQNCSHEVAELIKQVHDLTNNNIFINLFPHSCTEFVEQGTELGLYLFHPRINLIINIGMPAISINTINDLMTDCSITLHAPNRGPKP